MGYSPLFGDLTLSNRQALQRQYFKLGRRTPVLRELLDTLIGAAAGSTATLTQTRVAHSLTELGGKRTIETVNRINRATTAADVTALKDYLDDPSNPASSYTSDKAGGGRLTRPSWPA